MLKNKVNIILIMTCVLLAKHKINSNKKQAQLFRVYNLFPNFFPQPTKLQHDCPDFSKEVIPVTILEEFQTKALFDILKISDAVAAAHPIFNAARDCKNKISTMNDIVQHVEQNQSKLTFFVQADVRESLNKNLDSEDSPWKMSLESGCEKINAAKVIKISHNNISQQLFGDKASPRKKLYKVEFDLSGSDLVQGKLRRGPLTMVFRSYNLEKKVPIPAECL